MDVVLGGARGLIGSALRASLGAEGHRVISLVRGGVTQGDEIGWDPASGRVDAPALEGVDAVVHLAGEGIGERRWTNEQKRRIRDSRLRGTAAIAAAVATRERKPRAFVCASAIGYYGDRGDELLTEDSPPGNDFVATLCVDWEAETAPAAAAGVRTVNLRSGIVLARHGGVLQRLLVPFRLGVGGKQGTGRQWMSWIALDDEIAAIRAAIDDARLEGPVNLVAPNPVTNQEFARALAHVLHRPALLPTPMLPLRVRYGGELVRTLLLASQRIEPAALERVSFTFRFPLLEPALRAIVGRGS